MLFRSYIGKRGGWDSVLAPVRVSPWSLLSGNLGNLGHGGKGEEGTGKGERLAAGRFPGCSGKLSGGVGQSDTFKLSVTCCPPKAKGGMLEEKNHKIG